MSLDLSTFSQCQPLRWNGRHARKSGRMSVFHLKYVRRRLWPVVFWERGNVKGLCAAVECDSANQLAESVKATKIAAGGDGGGSFVINEFGQVLVPSSNGSGSYLVGELHGRLLFDNPFEEGESLDLGQCDHLEAGDPWDLPYVGIPYSLSRSGSVYACQKEVKIKCKRYPIQQDTKLVRALQKVRGDGGCQFIVNPLGVVLTRINQKNGSLTMFVGRINYDFWFEKENELGYPCDSSHAITVAIE